MWDWVYSTPRLCLDSKEVHSGFWACFRMLHQQVSLPVRLCYSLLPHTMFFFFPCNCVRELNSLVVCLKEILSPWYGPDRFLGVTIWLHRWMVLSNGLEEGIRERKVNFFLQNSKKPQKSTLFSGHSDYFLKKRTLVVFSGGSPWMSYPWGANSSALRFVACFDWEPRKNIEESMVNIS